MSDPAQPGHSAAELFGGFWLGTIAAVAFALATFGERVLTPRESAFECFALGALTAAMLALVVRGRSVEAGVLVPAYALLRLAFADGGRWRIALSALLLAAGAFLVASIFDRVGRMGVRFGKFLIAGPLLGGVCLAVAPLSEYPSLSVYDAFDPLMLQLFAGIVIGDGAGLGIEVADLLSPSRRRSPEVASRAPAAELPRQGTTSAGRSAGGGA